MTLNPTVNKCFQIQYLPGIFNIILNFQTIHLIICNMYEYGENLYRY